MKTRMLIIITAAALGTAWPQSASRDLRLSDLKAKQPKEAILDSALCRRAREAPNHHIDQHPLVDPKTLLPDLNSLMEKSDDVVLAMMLDYADLVSPSGENPVTYYEVQVLHSWKGPHHAGDILTYGWPGGRIRCDPALVQVWPMGELGGNGNSSFGDSVMVLFLRQSKDQEEAQLIEGLRPAGGGGTQGIFPIQIPSPKTDLTDACDYLLDPGIANKNAQRCVSFLETNQSPIGVPYVHDPLHKYSGMPAADFLQEVQSVAAGPSTAATGP